MRYQESETVELKAVVISDIKKEIIAFANCDGGKLYIGVNDDGSILGVEDPDSVSLQISNMVRDSIKPDLTMFLHYDTIEEDGKAIVEVEIQRGTDRPYYIAKKGMRPEGVYVRQGYSSVPATDSAIRRMIKETDGDCFESMRSLKLMDRDGLYTNLALLLSDQCAHTIKVAVFQGTDQVIFTDRREFGGSLMRQMNEVYDFIDFRNRTRATIEKLTRIDTRDYPEIAVREALLNLLVHRDYAYSASALISMYEDRIEFVSIGGLVPGIELEDVMAGISVCRNQELANVFYRLHLIEAYGTGLGKILRAYEEKTEQPTITTTNNSFKIILPNINSRSEMKEAVETRTTTAVETNPETRPADDTAQQILQYARTHGEITRADVEQLFGISAASASRRIRNLVTSKQLRQIGKARNIRYTVYDV